MALPPETYRHVNRWIGTLPSPWWIHRRLRFLGYLAPGASAEVVRGIVRDAIAEEAREREQAAGRIVLDLEPWNTRVPARLLEAKVLSPKGDEMARWHPFGRPAR